MMASALPRTLTEQPCSEGMGGVFRLAGLPISKLVSDAGWAAGLFLRLLIGCGSHNGGSEVLGVGVRC